MDRLSIVRGCVRRPFLGLLRPLAAPVLEPMSMPWFLVCYRLLGRDTVVLRGGGGSAGRIVVKSIGFGFISWFIDHLGCLSLIMLLKPL